MVSVIIPCRNEARFIEKCLDSVVANDYPKDKMEVLVVDGMSEDRTREIAARYAQKHPFIRVLENPKRVTPAAMNIGIRKARGDLVMKMDSHTTYEPDYISECVRSSREFAADNVGGVLVTVPESDTAVGRAICLASSHRFGVGNSYFRVGSDEPREVDTVSFGCYRREVFEKVGFYNEELVRGQDMELNLRLKRAGGKIMLVPSIVAQYHNKSEFASFFKHRFIDGMWAIYPFKYTKHIPVSLRHLIPAFFVATILVTGAAALVWPLFRWFGAGIVGLYLLANLYFSARIAWSEKDLRQFPLVAIAFAVLHVSYGLGSIWAIVKINTWDRMSVFGRALGSCAEPGVK